MNITPINMHFNYGNNVRQQASSQTNSIKQNETYNRNNFIIPSNTAFYGSIIHDQMKRCVEILNKEKDISDEKPRFDYIEKKSLLNAISFCETDLSKSGLLKHLLNFRYEGSYGVEQLSAEDITTVLNTISGSSKTAQKETLNLLNLIHYETNTSLGLELLKTINLEIQNSNDPAFIQDKYMNIIDKLSNNLKVTGNNQKSKVIYNTLDVISSGENKKFLFKHYKEIAKIAQDEKKLDNLYAYIAVGNNEDIKNYIKEASKE